MTAARNEHFPPVVTPTYEPSLDAAEGTERRPSSVLSAMPRIGTSPLGQRPAAPAAAGAPAGGGTPVRPIARRTAPAYRGIPAPVRVAAWMVFAVAAGWAVGTTAPPALRRIGELIALQPQILPWYSVRALGFLAYLAFAASTIYGLMLSTKLLDAIAHRPISIALHKDLAIAGVVLSALHGGLLLADGTFAFTPAALLVPFRSPYAPFAVGVGQVAFYLLAAIVASFYIRRRIGQRAWRFVHYLTFAGYAGIAVHGVASGTDTATLWAFALYVAPAAVVVFLFGFRLTVAVATAAGGASARLRSRLAPRPQPTAPARAARQIGRPLQPAPAERVAVARDDVAAPAPQPRRATLGQPVLSPFRERRPTRILGPRIEPGVD